MRAAVERTYGKWRMWRKGGFFNGARVVPYEGAADGNEALREVVAAERPLMVARYGLYELQAVTSHRYGHPPVEKILPALHFNAGFFPAEARLVGRFAEEYGEATALADCFCAWNYRHGLWPTEERVFRELCPDARLMDLHALACFERQHPWTEALAGRRVLVVHPFAAAIERQYRRRELLFRNPAVLPRFGNLTTIPAVQSIAGNPVPFPDWFAALDHMRREMEAADFEVALIGAGAYGLPLAAHAKRLGRQGVHLGGVTQILFGIMGRRWERQYRHLVNDAWVRPGPDDRPPGFDRIEDGCYW